MRSKFPGYYSPTEEQIKELTDNATIVLDANVLLDLYRYSEETVKILLDTIESYKDRIFIPYQASLEYHINLNDVISAQIEKYENTIKKLEDFKNLLETKRSHPFLSKDLHEKTNDFCKEINEELSTKKRNIEDLILKNPIKEKLANILDNKVGEPFSEEELEDIYQEGEKRYKSKIPPGYKDYKKEGNRKYGDLVVWKEILKLSKEKNYIILVSSDTKEDWYLDCKGKKIGPRPELIDEFYENKSNKQQCCFHMYSTAQFLEYFKTTDVSKEVLEEVEKITEKMTFEYTENDDNTTIIHTEEIIGEIDVDREQ